MSERHVDAVYDPGLQPERTLLAWRRTALAVAVLSAVGVRFTVASLGWPAVALGVSGVGLGFLSYLASGLGYRCVHHHLARTDRHAGDGWPQLILAVAVLILGVTALLYVLLAG